MEYLGSIYEVFRKYLGSQGGIYLNSVIDSDVRD